MTERWDVLVVDDERVVLEGVRMLLRDAGLTVAMAEDASSALCHPALSSCRLVLCDLMLPDGSGIEVLRRLRATHPSLPVVMMTGYATSDSEHDASEAGASGFLPKPFEESELLSVVRRALSPESDEEEES